jgi:hypothetical protein
MFTLSARFCDPIHSIFYCYQRCAVFLDRISLTQNPLLLLSDVLFSLDVFRPQGHKVEALEMEWEGQICHKTPVEMYAASETRAQIFLVVLIS